MKTLSIAAHSCIPSVREVETKEFLDCWRPQPSWQAPDSTRDPVSKQGRGTAEDGFARSGHHSQHIKFSNGTQMRILGTWQFKCYPDPVEMSVCPSKGVGGDLLQSPALPTVPVLLDRYVVAIFIAGDFIMIQMWETDLLSSVPHGLDASNNLRAFRYQPV